MNWIIKGLMGYIGMMALMVAAQFGFYSVMPTSYWFVYYDVIPTHETYQIGEPITFNSVSDIYRPVEMEWNDIFYCTYNGVRQYTAVYPSGKIYEQAQYNTLKELKPWVWSGRDPQRPTSCELESHACAVLPYGIKKCQKTIVEEVFNLEI